jgi:hypothetical protein
VRRAALVLLAMLSGGACSGHRATARDIDDAAAVLLAVSACERAGRVDEACVAAAASAARAVLPRLQASAAPSGSAP